MPLAAPDSPYKGAMRKNAAARHAECLSQQTSIAADNAVDKYARNIKGVCGLLNALHLLFLTLIFFPT